MLVLKRKVGERIMIGDDITVTVVENNRHHGLRIGVSAPESVRIYREEVYNQIHGKESGDGTAPRIA